MKTSYIQQIGQIKEDFMREISQLREEINEKDLRIEELTWQIKYNSENLSNLNDSPLLGSQNNLLEDKFSNQEFIDNILESQKIEFENSLAILKENLMEEFQQKEYNYKDNISKLEGQIILLKQKNLEQNNNEIIEKYKTQLRISQENNKQLENEKKNLNKKIDVLLPFKDSKDMQTLMIEMAEELSSQKEEINSLNKKNSEKEKILNELKNEEIKRLKKKTNYFEFIHNELFIIVPKSHETIDKPYEVKKEHIFQQYFEVLSTILPQKKISNMNSILYSCYIYVDEYSIKFIEYL